MARKTLRSYVESMDDVSSVSFLGSFGGQDGDLREYVILKPAIVGADVTTMNIQLTGKCVYLGRQDHTVMVANHRGDYAA